jgi:hypothetical protein
MTTLHICKLFTVVKVKVKVKLSLCFNWEPRHEGVLWERMYISTHSLTSALDGGEWLTSSPGRFTPRERASGTHWIGGWVGPRAVLDAMVKRKIPFPRRESNPRTPIFQPVVQRYTDWAIAAFSCILLLFLAVLATRSFLPLQNCRVSPFGLFRFRTDFWNCESFLNILVEILGWEIGP